MISKNVNSTIVPRVIGMSLSDALELLKIKEKAAREISNNLSTLGKKSGRYNSVRTSRVLATQIKG